MCAPDVDGLLTMHASFVSMCLLLSVMSIMITRVSLGLYVTERRRHGSYDIGTRTLSGVSTIIT